MIDNITSSQLALQAEELESLEALAWDWGHFFIGVGVGISLVGLGVGVALT